MLPPDFAPPRALVADDQPDVLEALRLLLTQHDFVLRLVTSPAALLDRLAEEDWDVVLMDLNYSRDTTSGEEGLKLLAQVRQMRPALPVVVMTAWGNIELAVEAMRAGAQSFVQKPWDNVALVQILQREVAEGRGARERSERHEREHQEARLIQRALMPASLPLTNRFEVVGNWQPAGSFGGDCYDSFTFGPETIGLSIADVAGKGLPAALLMSSLQAAVRAFARDQAPPHALCASVNRLLCGQMVSGRFVTFAYVQLDCVKGLITYANAGHNPPLVARASGEIETLTAGGMVLGVLPEAEYTGGELPLRAGDRLLLYTDGISEARSDTDEEFGDARVADALRRHRHLDARALHAALLAEVKAFAPAGFEDDATLLAVAVR
jgi:phosphoserine phosphatase RsbU/P